MVTMSDQSSVKARKRYILNRLKIFSSSTSSTNVSLNSYAINNELNQQQILNQKSNQAIKLPIKCHIKSCEGELMREITIHKHHSGQYLLSNLREALNLSETKCFGLKIAGRLDDQEDLVKSRWLDLASSVYRQIKDIRKHINVWQEDDTKESYCVVFYLRIKFYPPNPDRITDLFTLNYLWLQLRRDLKIGQLTSTYNNMALLAACVFQFEFGNYSELSVPDSNQYCSRIQVLPNQKSIEQLIIQIHQCQLYGMSAQQAQLHFLRVAVTLETYGFDYYPVRDHQKQRGMFFGFNYAGIKTIRNGRVLHHFKWQNIKKVTYERRMIIFHTSIDNKKQIIGFKCSSLNDCNNLYHRILEQRYFFTVTIYHRASVDLISFEANLKRSCLRHSNSTDEYRRFSRQSLQCSSPSSAYHFQDYQLANNSDLIRYYRYDYDERPNSRSSNISSRSHLITTEPSLIGMNNHQSVRRFQAKLQRQHSVFFADSRNASPAILDDHFEDIDETMDSNYSIGNNSFQSQFAHLNNRPQFQSGRIVDNPPSIMSSIPPRTLSFGQISQLSSDNNDPAPINCFMSDSSSEPSIDTSEKIQATETMKTTTKSSSEKVRGEDDISTQNERIIIRPLESSSSKVYINFLRDFIDNVACLSKYIMVKLWFTMLFTLQQISQMLISRSSRNPTTTLQNNYQSNRFRFMSQFSQPLSLMIRDINNGPYNRNMLLINTMKFVIIIVISQLFCALTRSLFDYLFDKL